MFQIKETHLRVNLPHMKCQFGTHASIPCWFYVDEWTKRQWSGRTSWRFLITALKTLYEWEIPSQELYETSTKFLQENDIFVKP